jgi:7-cyano-7-deazaguanine synthase
MTSKKSEKAVVLLSGGMDSTISLYWALKQGWEPFCLHFKYGQRHGVETESAIMIAKKELLPIKVLNIAASLREVTSSVLIKKKSKPSPFPATWVPGRNLLFLSYAGMYAYTIGAEKIVIGISQVDYSGYPDCRARFKAEMEDAISSAMDKRISILAPLMAITKAESLILAKTLPGCWDALALTHTCYHGKRPPCGECDACRLRAKAFQEVGCPDPILCL